MKKGPDPGAQASNPAGSWRDFARFSARLADHMSRVLDVLVDDLWIISIDRRGMDVRVRTDGSSLVRRISFNVDVERFEDAARAVECALADDDLCSPEF